MTTVRYDHDDMTESYGVNYIAERLYFDLGGDADDENQDWYHMHADFAYSYAEVLYEAETRARIRNAEHAVAAYLNA